MPSAKSSVKRLLSLYLISPFNAEKSVITSPYSAIGSMTFISIVLLNLVSPLLQYSSIVVAPLFLAVKMPVVGSYSTISSFSIPTDEVFSTPSMSTDGFSFHSVSYVSPSKFFIVYSSTSLGTGLPSA